MRPTNEKVEAATDNPFPLLGDLPQIAQEKNVVIAKE